MKENRNCIMKFRATEDEKAAIMQKVEAADMTISEYLRRCALDKQVIAVNGLDDIAHELRAIGNNINQMTRAVNSGYITPLGTTAYKREKGYGGEMVPITLARCIDFLELLKDKKDVNYVLACSKIESHDYIWFIDTEELDEYIDNIEDYKNMTFLSFKPHVMYGRNDSIS